MFVGEDKMKERSSQNEWKEDTKIEGKFVSKQKWLTMEMVSCNGILRGCKREATLTLSKSMGGPGEYYAKWNKPVREKEIPYDLAHMWNLMNKINWWTK